MQIKVNVETGQVKIMPNKKLGTIVTMSGVAVKVRFSPIVAP